MLPQLANILGHDRLPVPHCGIAYDDPVDLQTDAVDTDMRFGSVPHSLYLRLWRRGGRPRIDGELRALIRRMSRENPTWGAPRIHGELLMLCIEVSESTVGRYMIRIGRPRSQGWKTFLRNHSAGIGSLDLFVVRTISFKLLYAQYAFPPVRCARRRNTLLEMGSLLTSAVEIT